VTLKKSQKNKRPVASISKVSIIKSYYWLRKTFVFDIAAAMPFLPHHVNAKMLGTLRNNEPNGNFFLAYHAAIVKRHTNQTAQHNHHRNANNNQHDRRDLDKLKKASRLLKHKAYKVNICATMKRRFSGVLRRI
jgi:hypothetical protein